MGRLRVLEMDEELEYVNRQLSRMQTKERKDVISENQIWNPASRAAEHMENGNWDTGS